MKLEVEIYMNGVIKFFNENPKDLQNLVPENKKEILFEKIREKASENSEKGEEVTITKNQIIEICVEINTEVSKLEIVHTEGPILKTKYGEICLN